ncbi:unnamed protein product [Euphydryas editha]|uniref:Uncharacterized protein n=1 Tax=Euphydryas editha TaxID=104508 RepID=A0AAU9V9P1_EUPED|nr:unnamed protein product [Euphydryas editha]
MSESEKVQSACPKFAARGAKEREDKKRTAAGVRLTSLPTSDYSIQAPVEYLTPKERPQLSICTILLYSTVDYYVMTSFHSSELP